MTLLPDIPLPALLLGVLALVAFCIWRAVAARTQLVSWIRRAVMVLLVAGMISHPGVPGGLVPTGAVTANVFLVIDTSQSMAAEDWGGETRLDGVREDVRDIAYAFAGADISVITFNSRASVNVPLTSDGSAVIEMTRAMRPEIAETSRGSSIGSARDLLVTEVERLRSASPGEPIIVIYMGDGEQTAADPIESFADLRGAVTGGLVLGYGTEDGARMPRSTYTGLSDEYVIDPATGEPAISRIDQANLRTIADETGLTYLQRGAGSDVKPALQGLSQGEAEISTERMRESRLDLYWAFAYPLALLLAWEGFHIARQIRKSIQPKERS